MPDKEKVIDRLKKVSRYFKSMMMVGYDGDLDIYREHRESVKMAIAMLEKQEAVEPRVSTAEQRCGHCNKVIEMDGWQSCPWCGKRIDWKGWWKKNGTRNQDS